MRLTFKDAYKLTATHNNAEMLNELNQQIREATKQARLSHEYESQIKEKRNQRRQQQNSRSDCRVRLIKTTATVDSFKHCSLKGLFYSLLGKKKEKLRQAIRTHRIAQLAFDESMSAVEKTEAEILEMELRNASLFKARGLCTQLLNEKEDVLVGLGDNRAQQILALSKQIDHLAVEHRELEAAISAGRTAVGALQKADSYLRSASDWGTLDMLGGGMVSSMVKHEKINKAKQYAQLAQRYIQSFQKELIDAGLNLQASLEIDSFLKAADFIFDGIIADWMVQSKIKKALLACIAATVEVERALEKCNRQAKAIGEAINQARQAKADIIDRA